MGWGGFLLWYGFGALKTAMSSNTELASAEVMKQGRWKIIATMLAVTWLNPHVYLDTFVVLGSLGGQLDVEPRRWFALGTVSASFLWFFGLALLAAWLAPRLRTAKAQRIINMLVGTVMWFIAFQLAKKALRMFTVCSTKRCLMDNTLFRAKLACMRPEIWGNSRNMEERQ